MRYLLSSRPACMRPRARQPACLAKLARARAADNAVFSSAPSFLSCPSKAPHARVAPAHPAKREDVRRARPRSASPVQRVAQDPAQTEVVHCGAQALQQEESKTRPQHTRPAPFKVRAHAGRQGLLPAAALLPGGVPVPRRIARVHAARQLRAVPVSELPGRTTGGLAGTQK